MILNDVAQDDNACGTSGQCTCMNFVLVNLHDSLFFSLELLKFYLEDCQNSFSMLQLVLIYALSLMFFFLYHSYFV